jgi:hypothetical protein
MGGILVISHLPYSPVDNYSQQPHEETQGLVPKPEGLKR